jgi:DNA-binding winged helix-turn-helix (wHTH) protein
VVVTDESLSKAIFDLRKFLLGNFTGVPHIVTIRKVGYKLELKETTPTHNHRIVRSIAKVFVYILALIALFIIIVRAIRYEN